MTNELAQHLAALNAKTRAWVAEDPDNRWAGLYVEELDFWAEMGITTVAQFKRHENETLFWDMYKEVFGCRPRHVNLKDMSDTELEQEIEILGRMAEDFRDDQEQWDALEMAFAQEAAEEENAKRDEEPLAIDYVACKHQDGWL